VRPERVLIFRHASLGDTIVTLPAFYLLKKVFSDAERRLLGAAPISGIFTPAAAILENSGLVHGFM